MIAMEWLSVSNEIVGLATGLVAIVTPVGVWLWNKRKHAVVDIAPKSMPARFIALFESHGVHRNQIPSFFGYGLTLSDLKNDDSLLAKLTPEMLDAAASQFSVNREWLEGASEQVYKIHSFYKQPQEFSAFVDGLLAQGNPLDGYVFNTSSVVSKTDRSDALIMITEEISWINDRAIYKVHLCGGWIFNYWKCRAYIAACVAIAWRKKLCFIGKQVDAEWLEKFATGKELISYDFADGYLSYPTRSTWYADEFVETPEKYLKGVDPERNRFGIKAALSKWLDLDDRGYMQMYDDGSHKAMRARFERALELHNRPVK